MRKIFSLIAAVLFAGSMMATEVSVTIADYASSNSWANDTKYTSVNIDENVTATVSGGGNTGKYYTSGNEWRLYQTESASITIATKSGTLSSVTITYAIKNTGELKDGETAVVSGTAVSVIGDSKTFTVGNSGSATNGQVKITAIAVTYTPGETPEPACKWDEIAFLGNGSGVAAYTDRFKVCTGDPAPTAVVNIQSPDWAAEPGIYLNFPSADWGAISLAEDQYKIQGAGILLYVSAFLYDAETEVTIVCQEVTYTLTVKNVSPDEKPVAKKTCAEVYALAKNDAVALNDVVVTFVNGKNVWVKDATGAMLLYLSADATWKAGDVLAGVAGTVDIYKGLYEVKPSADQAAAVVATAGEAPAPEELAAIDLDKDMNKYIILKNVAVSGPFASNKLTMTVGENEYELFNKFNSDYAFVAEKKYDIVGIASIYNSLQVLFINATENTATAIDNTVVSEKAIKMFENGQLIIIKNGVKYNALGSVIE